MNVFRSISLALVTVAGAMQLSSCGGCGGGSADFTVSNPSSDLSASQTALHTDEMSGTVATGSTSTTILASLCGGGSPSRNVTIFLRGRPIAGMLYPVTIHTDGSDTYLTYSEGIGTAAPTSQWRGRSGNITIRTLDLANHTLTFALAGVVLEPDPSFGGNHAAGTFQFDGTGSLNAVSGP